MSETDALFVAAQNRRPPKPKEPMTPFQKGFCFASIAMVAIGCFQAYRGRER